MKPKVGRPKAIESPEELAELFEGYKKEVKGNPFRIKDWVGKDATQIEREREKPLIMEGFEVYVSKKTGKIQDLDQYFANSNGNYSEFSSICREIKNEIRTDQISGGMANLYNASLTARVAGLVDKTETTIKEQPLFGDEE